MKRRVICFIFIILTILLNSSFAKAETTDSLEQTQQEAIEGALKTAPDSIKRYLSEKTDNDEPINISNAFIEILQNSFNDTSKYLKTPIRLFGTMLAIILLYSVVSNVTSDRISKNNIAIKVAVCVSVAVAVSSGVLEMINTSLDTVELSNEFVKGFIPVYTGVMISTGNVTSAALYGASLIGVSNLVSRVIVWVIKPLIGIMLGLSVVAGIYVNGFHSLVGALKKTAVWILGIAMSVFTSIVKLQSIISAGNDSLTFRTSRFLVSSSVPIIGASVSEALSTVTGGLSVIKNKTGIIGVISVCAIFLPQLIACLLCGVSLYASSIIAEITGASDIALTIRSVKSCIDIVVALLTFYFLIIVICTAVMMSIGVVT